MDYRNEVHRGKKAIIDFQSILGCGKEYAIPMRELAASCGLSQRALRAAVTEARRRGEFIMSSSAGYYYPASVSDVEEYAAIMRSRALSTFTTLSVVNRWLREHEKQLSGQMSFDALKEEMNEQVR